VWALGLELVRLRLSIWQARRHRLGADPAYLAAAHRRLAKLYGSLALHRKDAENRWNAAKLERRAAHHASEARWYGHLDLLRSGRRNAGRLGGRRGPDPRDPSDSVRVPHYRGPRPPSLVGGAEAQIEEYVRVRAVAASTERNQRRAPNQMMMDPESAGGDPSALAAVPLTFYIS
jgi:hypothetical protein